MTSKLTREERVQALYDMKVGQVLSLDDIENVKMLASMALAAMDRDKVRQEHAEWSQATFGNVGPVGPLKHLSKEALEAAEQPGDLSEWADMQFLLWDAQRRAGITDAQITQAMIEKLAVNKQRSWPEPKDGEPRLHIKEQQEPVGEREPIAWLNDAYLARGVVDGEAGSEDAGPGYIPVYREAGPQPAPVVPEKCPAEIRDLISSHTDALFNDDDAQEIWNACRAAMLRDVTLTNEGNIQAEPQNAPQNIPEIIPGWIPVSERLPFDEIVNLPKPMGGPFLVAYSSGAVDISWYSCRQDITGRRGEWDGETGTLAIAMGRGKVTHWMPRPAAPQEMK
nr:MAG TPA: Protein of unknown function (DUF550) [Bacteriophage sp.]